jgi:hypothetical protein
MLNFEYHYGNEADMYAFYRIPKVLVKHDYFKDLCDSAKVLFGLMLDRLSLSLKNDWKDGKNRVYIYYTLEDIQDDLRCAHGKAVKLLSDLDNVGLIDRVKQGQGRPTRIYVKKFTIPDEYEDKAGSKDLPKEEVQTSDNKKSRLPKKGSTDFRNGATQTSEIEKSRLPITETQASDNEKSKLPITGSADFPKSERNNNRPHAKSSIHFIITNSGNQIES